MLSDSKRYLVRISVRERSVPIEHVADDVYVWEGFFCIREANGHLAIWRYPMGNILCVNQRGLIEQDSNVESV
jgi:hypothetical protein